MNKEQELLNHFYLLNQEVKEYKCMRLKKEEISIISKALSLLEGTDTDTAKQQYEDYLKRVEEMSIQRNCDDCRFFDDNCKYNRRNKNIYDKVKAATDCEHYDFGMYNEFSLEKSNYK